MGKHKPRKTKNTDASRKATEREQAAAAAKAK